MPHVDHFRADFRDSAGGSSTNVPTRRCGSECGLGVGVGVCVWGWGAYSGERVFVENNIEHPPPPRKKVVQDGAAFQIRPYIIP